MNFKELADKDIGRVFHNPDEFAEPVEFYYDGQTYDTLAVIDYIGAEGMDRKSRDYADDFTKATVAAYIPFDDLGLVPRRGFKVELNGERYTILKSAKESGEIILYLEAMDE